MQIGGVLENMATSNAILIAKIDDVFSNLARDLLHSREISISVSMKTSIGTKLGESSTGSSVESLYSPRLVCFPGSSSREAWRFSMGISPLLGLLY